MHTDTMLKFGTLFDLAKYFEHTQKFQRTGYGRGVVGCPHIKFLDTLFISEISTARKLEFVFR